jgi:hypothetical protein
MRYTRTPLTAAVRVPPISCVVAVHFLLLLLLLLLLVVEQFLQEFDDHLVRLPNGLYSYC